VLSDQVEEPGEALIKGNIHIQNDVLDALKTPDGLVGKLRTLLGVRTAAIQRVSQRGERQRRNEQTATVERRRHDAEALVFLTEDGTVWYFNLIERNGTRRGLHPHLFALHFLVMHPRVIHRHDEARRAVSTASFR